MACAAITCSPIVATDSRWTALKSMRRHSLGLDGVCSCTDDTVAAVDSLSKPGYALAAIRATSALHKATVKPHRHSWQET